jgi:hypothetical protein
MVSGFATSPISHAATSWGFFMDGKACARVEIVAGPLTSLTTLTARGAGSPHLVLPQGSRERLAARQKAEEAFLVLLTSLNEQGLNARPSPRKCLCRSRFYGVPVLKGEVQ